MKKLINILFYSFLLFLIINSILVFYKKVNYVFIGLFLTLSLIIIIYQYKRIKLDIVDFLLVFLPISYMVPYIVHNNAFDLSMCIYFILLELSVTMALLVLRRNIDDKKVNVILTTISIIGCIYFFVSFLYPTMSKEFERLGIVCYFGDTYINSIDRLYGALMYGNASALLFVIASFISLFKINNSKKYKDLFKITLFINFVGFLSTFSKMLFIAFILVLISLIILKIIMKQKDFLSTIKSSIIGIIVPSLLFIRLFRTYLINLNFIYFIIMLLLLIVVYICLCELLIYLDTKWKYSSYTYLAIITLFITLLTIKPIDVPLKIYGLNETNDYIISDFILEENKNYEITLNVTGNMDTISFELYKLYRSDYDDVPNVKMIDRIKASENNIFRFKTDEDFEYYFICINGLYPYTNLKISDLKINKKEYLINTFFVPYQYIHQLDLIKYDGESVAHRFWYYKDSLKLIKENKSIIGEGYNTFEYYSLKGKFNHFVQNPHSYLFQLWLDVGIYGPIYIIGLIVIGVINMFKYRFNDKKHIWFCIFCSCMIIVPFDAVFSSILTKTLLMLSFLMICEYKEKEIN